MTQSPNPFPDEIENQIVRGKIEARDDPDPDRAASPGYEISVTYSAPLEVERIEPPPTPATTAAAKKHPATKAYIEFDKAIRAGDKARLMALTPAEYRELMKANFAEMLKVVREQQPRNIKVLEARQKLEGSAMLTLTGTQEGRQVKGEAYLKLIEGKWILANQTWRDVR